jgi:hypothetical protein
MAAGSGVGSRLAAVPVEAVALLGEYVALMGLTPERLRALPTRPRAIVRRDGDGADRGDLIAGRLAGLGIGLRDGVRYTDMCAFRAIDRAALASIPSDRLRLGGGAALEMLADHLLRRSGR